MAAASREEAQECITKLRGLHFALSERDKETMRKVELDHLIEQNYAFRQLFAGVAGL